MRLLGRWMVMILLLVTVSFSCAPTAQYQRKKGKDKLEKYNTLHLDGVGYGRHRRGN